MSTPERPALSAEEQARRRKVIESAAWDARMEGLPSPLPERVVLDELWISGQITRAERRERIDTMLKARDKLA